MEDIISLVLAGFLQFSLWFSVFVNNDGGFTDFSVQCILRNLVLPRKFTSQSRYWNCNSNGTQLVLRQRKTHCCRHKCFPVFPCAQHLLQTQILCREDKNCFWFCSETFCVRNKCFPVCARKETRWATVFPRLPPPLEEGMKIQVS